MRRALIGLSLATALGACGPQPAKEAAAPPAEAAAPAGGVDENTPARVLSGARPAFAPDYPGGSRGEETLLASSAGRRGGVLTFTTADAPQQVVDFYKSRAEAAGLSGAAATAHNGGLTYSVGGPAGDLVVVAIPERGRTGVMTTWSVPDPR